MKRWQLIPDEDDAECVAALISCLIVVVLILVSITILAGEQCVEIEPDIRSDAVSDTSEVEAT